jgi:hypothetical protein
MNYYIENLDVEKLVELFSQKHKYNTKYLINSDMLNKQDDCILNVVKQIVPLIEGRNIAIALKNDKMNHTYTGKKAILFLEDKTDYFHFSSNLSHEEYMYKEFVNKEVFLTPIVKQKIYINCNKYMYGIGKNEDGIIDDAILRLELENVDGDCVYNDYLYEPNHIFNKDTSIVKEDVENMQYDDIPYLLNTLLYECNLCDILKIENNKNYKIRDFNKETMETELCEFKVNIQNEVKYSHIGFVNNFYPTTDCDWIIENIKNLKYDIEKFPSGITHILHYSQIIIEKTKEFYDLPKLLKIDEIHINVVNNLQNRFFEDDLCYIIIKVTDGKSSIQFRNITYTIEKGCALFCLKNNRFDISTPHENDYYIFVNIKAFSLNHI